MPHTNRKRKAAKKVRPDGKAPADQPLRHDPYIVAIPDFKPQSVQRYTFRWTFDSEVLYTTAWTTQMMLDIYCIAVGGGTVQPCRLFNAMKLRSVKLWTSKPTIGDSFGVEFSPSLIAGYGGAPRIPVLGTKLGAGATTETQRMSYICAIPRKDELASQWFSAQQGVYTLFNIATPPPSEYGLSCLELDFDAVLVNGETPVVTSFTTAAAKGTIGTGNFAGYSLSGFRSVGLVNLATP